MPTVAGGRAAKKSSTSPLRSFRRSTTFPAASMPCAWNTCLIVCSQATKRLALALRPDGNGVPDLDGLAGDDHVVDEQFQQRPLAPEARLLQPLPHALAERLGMSRKASGLGLAIGVVCEFVLLAIKRD